MERVRIQRNEGIFVASLMRCDVPLKRLITREWAHSVGSRDSLPRHLAPSFAVTFPGTAISPRSVEFEFGSMNSVSRHRYDIVADIG